MCDSVASCLQAATLADPPRKSPSPSEISSYSSKEPTPGPSTSNQSRVDSASMSEDIVLESLISSIQEMLPDLGSGFLKVERYKKNLTII